MKTIQPSNRVNNVKPYYFAGKLREVARLNAEGRDIISLGIGGPDRMPPQQAIDALCDAARRPDSHSYQPFAGLPELRREMADWYRRVYGVTLDPETELLPLIGSKEGIMHISLAFLNPGDGVLVPNPGYPTYTSVSKLVEAEIFTYDLTAENSWQPDFEALEKLPLERIKLMWVNYPHMPTGAPASEELLQKIVDFGRKHNIVIAHDNPYSFILNDRPLSILSANGARDICIEMNSLSKSHNMAGWRMAMVATNPTFLQWIIKVKSNVDSGQFKPAMLAAIEALRQGPEWSRELNRHYAERRQVAEQIMTALGCTFDPAQRGMFLWGRLPDSVEDPEAFVDDILYNRRVFITPGFIFGSNGNRYVRISLCAPVETLRRALARLS
ncbi:MAG: aminotransferase class I/II-fold pyridoxal phosphate-dependent enzyme [Muribaculaceae bacterium]|nr:aminotransferase class I/II-fold pyridoxal phosphate-dependent enzyme [Muribaculaceae bacterium]